MPPWCAVALIVKVTGVQIDAGGALVGPQGPPGRDGVDGATRPMPAAQAQRTATQAIAALNVGELVAFDHLKWSREGIALESGCFKVPPGEGGVYELTVNLLWDAGSAAGRLDLAIVNATKDPPGGPQFGDGSTAAGGGNIANHIAGQYMTQSMSAKLEADEGDLLGVAALNRSAGPASVYGIPGNWTSMEICKLSHDPPG
jgi:hypothetical protein